jgi:PAS domain S-box-containing protein
MEQRAFLLTVPARLSDRRLALAVVAVSAAIFAAAAPFAQVQLPAVWGFVPSYQSALAINDLITAILLYAQFRSLRSRALLLLASGYLFTALMAVVHALSFPGLFAPTSLIGSGPQTTAWLYMFWHGGFPLLVIGYALAKRDEAVPQPDSRSGRGLIALSIAAVAIAVLGLALVATVGHDVLPAMMTDNGFTSVQVAVIWLVWSLSLSALVAVWRFARPHAILDVWLMVVMCAWLFDVALSGALNAHRFDLGFYAGRIYGLLAASFVLIVLLLETGALYARLAHVFELEQRQAADRITSINARLETLLDFSPLPIFSLDATGRVATWNSAAARIFGCPAGAIAGLAFPALPENAESDFDALHRRVMAGERVQAIQARWLHQDGRAREITYSGAPVRDAGQHITGAVYVAQDVTETNLLERRLAQSQKMEAVGQLTGGIAHDFNNILTVITGTIEMLEEAVADRPQLAAVARLIDEAASRGADLTGRLLAFARRQTLKPEQTDINVLATEAARLLRPTLGEHIEVEAMLEEGAWPALVDRSLLVTALLNLAINARDAMPNGGKLTLETGNVILDVAYAAANPDAHAGPYVMIAVSDTGFGIPAAIRDKVFEPFFTTKEVGKGTGLGLSMVYGFVKQSGGHIKIYSEEGHGTSIKLYLPRASDEVQLLESPPSAASETGNEAIVVVEDDRLVREYVIVQLQNLGYAVTAAANGTEALALIEGGAKADLLFTDVIIPGGMNGRELADEALRCRPGLKILFTSGYTESAIVHHGRLDPGVLLLAKPYRKTDLARMIRRALDEPQSPPDAQRSAVASPLEE